MPPTIILASASPRRQAFLRQLDLPFETRVADIDETPFDREAPDALACRLAATKASAIVERTNEESGHRLIVASDTVVAQEGEILGKPADEADAARMLRLLRGRSHQVHSAICVLDTQAGDRRTRLNTTTVTMRSYSDDEISAYIATGDPMDKAGAYAIQHPDFAPVAALDGCFAGVMGFPLADLQALLAERGVVIITSLRNVCQRHTNFRCCQEGSASHV